MYQIFSSLLGNLPLSVQFFLHFYGVTFFGTPNTDTTHLTTFFAKKNSCSNELFRNFLQPWPWESNGSVLDPGEEPLAYDSVTADSSAVAVLFCFENGLFTINDHPRTNWLWREPPRKSRVLAGQKYVWLFRLIVCIKLSIHSELFLALPIDSTNFPTNIHKYRVDQKSL